MIIKKINKFIVKTNSHVKGNFVIFFKNLTGKIEYNPPNLNYKNFTGLFQLKKDPKGENFTDINAIYRGSAIKSTDWVIGITLFCGE